MIRTFFSPAKLNLFLHITGQRNDGYHELQTVFQLLDYGDRITLKTSQDGVIRQRCPLPGVSESDDLCLRAARLLRSRLPAGAKRALHGVEIEVQKYIPMGGGLGGGSSNAAAVLVGLNEMWQAGFERAALAEIGLQLGADVPVFVHGRSAWAEGVGEALTPVKLGSRWFLVVTPSISVATGPVFADPALTRNTPKLKIADFVCDGLPAAANLTRKDVADGADAIDLARMFEATHNDCQAVVAARFSGINSALALLAQYPSVRMTGTGASVFAVFGSRRAAMQAGKALPAELPWFVGQGMDAVTERVA